MSESELEQGLAAMRDALAGRLDGEELVAAQWFLRPNWQSSMRGLGRVLRRLVPSGRDDPQDRVRRMNVLALTPTRVVAFTARTGGNPPLSAADPIGEWPVGELTVGSERHTVESTSQSGSGNATHHSTKMTLISLRARGGQPLLEGDFPRSPVTNHLLDHLKQATA